MVLAGLHYGCALGPDRLCVLVARRRRRSWEAVEVREAPLPEGIFMQPPAGDQVAALQAALEALLPEARERLVPLHLALPDPLGLIRVWELQALPRQAAMQRGLLRLRFGELGIREDSYELQGQVLRRGTQPLFLGQAIEAAWLRRLQDAARRAGLTPWSINLAACYRYNSLFTRVQPPGGAAVLSFEPGSWTLSAWDAAGTYRYQRSRWRELEAPETEAQAIADQVERVLAALEYAHQPQIMRLHLLGEPQIVAQLRVQLEARTSPDAVLQIDLPGLSPAMLERAPLAASAFAASTA